MPEIREGKKRLCIWVPVEAHAKSQYLANLMGKSLQDFVSEAMMEKIEKEWK